VVVVEVLDLAGVGVDDRRVVASHLSPIEHLFDICIISLKYIKDNSDNANEGPGGVAQRTSHPPEDQKARVRIPSGYKAF
jgi:hypothetical protein